VRWGLEGRRRALRRRFGRNRWSDKYQLKKLYPVEVSRSPPQSCALGEHSAAR
jgi:hypothetical protein